MSEQDTNVESQQVTQVPNEGGPKIPGMPGKAPNMQGVPPEQVAGAPAEQAPPEAEAPTGADLDALKKLLGTEEEKEPPKDAPAPDEGDIELTGNPTIDAGIKLLQKVAKLQNSDVDRAMGNAIKFQNPELIDKSFLKERFGEHAEYAELLCQAYYKEAGDRTQAAVNQVFELAGGQDNWVHARDSFKAKAPAHQQAAAKALIDSGKVSEGVSLILDYCRSQGLVVTQGAQVKGQAGLAGAALSASEFSAEYAKLRKEAGNRSLQSGPFAARYESLLTRRQAGKSIGR